MPNDGSCCAATQTFGSRNVNGKSCHSSCPVPISISVPRRSLPKHGEPTHRRSSSEPTSPECGRSCLLFRPGATWSPKRAGGTALFLREPPANHSPLTFSHRVKLAPSGYICLVRRNAGGACKMAPRMRSARRLGQEVLEGLKGISYGYRYDRSPGSRDDVQRHVQRAQRERTLGAG